MREVAAAGQVHSDAGGLSSFNHLVVTDGTTRLDNCLHAGFGKHLETVGEGEESIGGSYRADHALTCALNSHCLLYTSDAADDVYQV